MWVDRLSLQPFVHQVAVVNICKSKWFWFSIRLFLCKYYKNRTSVLFGVKKVWSNGIWKWRKTRKESKMWRNFKIREIKQVSDCNLLDGFDYRILMDVRCSFPIDQCYGPYEISKIGDWNRFNIWTGRLYNTNLLRWMARLYHRIQNSLGSNNLCPKIYICIMSALLSLAPLFSMTQVSPAVNYFRSDRSNRPKSV